MKSTNHHAYRKLLGELVKARKEAGCSQADLGQRLEKIQSHVSKVESGERMLDVVEFVYWARAIGVDPIKAIATLVDAVNETPRKSRTRRSPA